MEPTGQNTISLISTDYLVQSFLFASNLGKTLCIPWNGRSWDAPWKKTAWPSRDFITSRKRTQTVWPLADRWKSGFFESRRYHYNLIKSKYRIDEIRRFRIAELVNSKYSGPSNLSNLDTEDHRIGQIRIFRITELVKWNIQRYQTSRIRVLRSTEHDKSK